MNILGIGVDIIEIHRIQRAALNNPKFIERIFTEAEIRYFESISFKAESIAGSFAAKEAISKAMGSGFKGFNFKDIEILRDENGRPYVMGYNNFNELTQELKVEEIMISISHCKEYAVANAVVIIKNK